MTVETLGPADVKKTFPSALFNAVGKFDLTARNAKSKEPDEKFIAALHDHGNYETDIAPIAKFDFPERVAQAFAGSPEDTPMSVFDASHTGEVLPGNKKDLMSRLSQRTWNINDAVKIAQDLANEENLKEAKKSIQDRLSVIHNAAKNFLKVSSALDLEQKLAA